MLINGMMGFCCLAQASPVRWVYTCKDIICPGGLLEALSFLEQIAGLVFTNPFSSERERIDACILGLSAGGRPFSERLTAIQEKTDQAFEALTGGEAFDIRKFPGRCRETLTLAWLFHLYHKFQDCFETHIRKQEQAGDQPVRVDFSRDLIEAFGQAGFGAGETARYIGLLFQAVRAFCFIDGQILGQCPSMTRLREILWNNIFTANPKWYFHHLSGRMEDFSTLILGETGTGKTLVASIIGRSGFIPFEMASGRFAESFTAAFQSINLAQFPTSLLESELFGHKKGAFTGAVSDHAGIFARCSRFGSVFIDEIGDIDVPTQVKLLNVLQERTFSPIGSGERVRFSGRVIAATHQDIPALLESGTFRRDLYYRLCSDVIVMPTLRERIHENPQELNFMVRRLLPKILHDPDDSLAAEIEALILDSLPRGYPWRGNIRELEQCIRQICIRGSYDFNRQMEGKKKAVLEDCFGHQPPLQELIADYCRYLYHRLGSYEGVARAAGIDRRTAKRYIGD